MSHTFLQRILFFAVLALICPITLAVDFYDGEIVVFRQLNSQGDTEELDIPTARHLDLNLQLQALLSKQPAIYLEPAIEGYLTNSSQRIASSPNYEILFYGRWSQTTSNRKTAPYIRIDLPSIQHSQALTGVLRLFSTDLLYIDTFLRYQPVKQEVGNQTLGSVERITDPYYFLKERRRVKFHEVHFIDHPKFGILLTVLPVKLPELPPATNELQPNTKTDFSNTP